MYFCMYMRAMQVFGHIFFGEMICYKFSKKHKSLLKVKRHFDHIVYMNTKLFFSSRQKIREQNLECKMCFGKFKGHQIWGVYECQNFVYESICKYTRVSECVCICACMDIQLMRQRNLFLKVFGMKPKQRIAAESQEA